MCRTLWNTGIPDTANYPPAVYEPCDWYDKRGNFWVFGGYSYVFGSNMADLWKYNPLTNEWTWMKGIGVIASVTDSRILWNNGSYILP
ncbi:MAG: hypothetical protein IPF81_19170 [Bacteroidetes bacterium]|nr:hypothetical protein [Bacteroidota bacterium]